MAIYADCGKRYLAVGHKLHIGDETFICTKKTGSDSRCSYCAFNSRDEQPCRVIACSSEERVYDDGSKGDKAEVYFAKE